MISHELKTAILGALKLDEWEFADSDAFKAAAATDEFKATGADAAEMGLPHSGYIADVDG